jgi:hypothetical protein
MRSTRTDRATDAGVAADGSGVIAVQTGDRERRRVRVITFDRHAFARTGPTAMWASSRPVRGPTSQRESPGGVHTPARI